MVYNGAVARNRITEGIILKNSRIGEIHKSVTLLSPDLGVINPIAHGAYKGKSKLGGATEVFSRLTAYLYHDPVRGSYKFTDAEPLSIYEHLRGDLIKYYIASLWSEVVIRTYAGGGDYAGTYIMLSEALELLDSCREDKNDTVLSLFLYRYVESLGYLPDFTTCSSCGRRMSESETWHISDVGEVRCGNCGREGQPGLSPGARRYLLHVTARPFQEMLRVNLDRGSAAELKRAMIAIAQHVIGGPLNTLKVAGGIL